MTSLTDVLELGDRRARRARRAAAVAGATDTPAVPSAPTPGASAVLPWAVVAVLAHVAVYVVFAASWVVVARAAIDGRLDGGAVLRWAGLVVALVPLRWLATTAAGYVAVDAGRALKRRLLDGVLALDQDAVRHAGVGGFLGMTMEAEALETLALTGGYLVVLGAVELVVAGVAVLAGVRTPALLAVLALVVAGVGVGVAVDVRRRRRWARHRLAMTHDLVERMVGHRTRLAQEGECLFDLGPDLVALERYERLGRRLDRVTAVLTAVLPRAWVAVAAVVLLVPFPDDADAAALGATVGGVLLASHALRKLTLGASQLSAAAVAWERVAPMLRARRRPSPPGARSTDAVVEAAGVAFRYGDRVHAVLDGVDLRIDRGDRVLLEGASGGGKSTLVSVLTGLREPTAGDVARGGVVVGVPQFHENHVAATSLAWNLLCGRRWPPTPADLAEAEAVCRDLGLGDVLGRMPGGLQQPVGETGWQLSHGERSRLFLARALLQEPDAVVLDETFAALDPDAFRLSLDCLLRRASTVVVVAHV